MGGFITTGNVQYLKTGILKSKTHFFGQLNHFFKGNYLKLIGRKQGSNAIESTGITAIDGIKKGGFVFKESCCMRSATGW